MTAKSIVYWGDKKAKRVEAVHVVQSTAAAELMVTLDLDAVLIKCFDERVFMVPSGDIYDDVGTAYLSVFPKEDL